MYRRDYLLKLTQQFAKMLSKLMGLKEQGEMEKANQLIEEAYKDLFDLDRKTLHVIPKEQLFAALTEEKKLSEEQLEVLAKIFVEDADINQTYENDFLEKALFILEELNVRQKMYSFEREALIQEIRYQLDARK